MNIQSSVHNFINNNYSLILLRNNHTRLKKLSSLSHQTSSLSFENDFFRFLFLFQSRSNHKVNILQTNQKKFFVLTKNIINQTTIILINTFFSNQKKTHTNISFYFNYSLPLFEIYSRTNLVKQGTLSIYTTLILVVSNFY